MNWRCEAHYGPPLDMILEFKLGMLDELARRYSGDVNGVFLTDDWGTQKGLFGSRAIPEMTEVMFDEFVKQACYWKYKECPFSIRISSIRP